jgi:ribonuclease HII
MSTVTLAEVEQYIRDHNPGTIVGVDEAGRGNWAGPIVAGAAAVSVANWTPPAGLTDSKLMSSKAGYKRREAIFDQVLKDDKVVIGIGVVEADEIDQIGIDAAQAKAQGEAIRGLFHRLVYPPFVVVDGINLPTIGLCWSPRSRWRASVPRSPSAAP